MKNVLLLFILFLSIDTNLSAQIKFFKSYSNGSDTTYAFQSVVQTQDEGYMAAGYKVFKDTSSSSTFYHGRGLIIKTDAMGNKVWERDYQYLNRSDLEFYDIKSVGPEQFLVCGLLGEDIRGASAYDFYVAKIDYFGNVIWQNIYPEMGAREWAYEIKPANDSVYYVTGWSDANSESVRLMKLDSAGNELWKRDYGGTSSKHGYALAITKDEKIYCGGQHVWGSSSGYMVKTDKNGDTIWTRTYANINDVRSIVAHDDGNFSMVGFAVDTVSRGYLALCDSNGTMLWKKDFDDTAMTWARSHTTTKEGGYIIGGISWLQGYDLAIIKTDGAGNLLWNKRYDYHHDYGYEIIQTSDNGFVLCGESGNNGIEAILLKTDSAGNSTNITTNISLVERKKIELYPNPAHDKISLSYEGNLKIRSIALYDLSGKCVRKYDPTQKQLSVEGLSTGIYLLKIQSDQQHFVEKLMIE